MNARTGFTTKDQDPALAAEPFYQTERCMDNFLFLFELYGIFTSSSLDLEMQINTQRSYY